MRSVSTPGLDGVSGSPDQSKTELHPTHRSDDPKSAPCAGQLCNPTRRGTVDGIIRLAHICPIESIIVLPAELQLGSLIQRGLEKKLFPQCPISRSHSRPTHTAAACVAPPAASERGI